MDERPAPPPEGLLIADALTRTGMSIRKAARAAGISYGRWRQITSGYQNVSPGSFARVRAPADTLARMARIVKVTPEQLEAADRADAASVLRDALLHSELDGRTQVLGDAGLQGLAEELDRIGGLSKAERDGLVSLAAAMRQRTLDEALRRPDTGDQLRA
jgi:transcriptional regulator with XRE-family HTH domain